MLKLHGFGFLLDEGKAGETTDFRQVLLASILATDMSRHFPFVGKLTEMGTRFKANDFKSSSVQDDRLLLCSGLMKCADISNPVSFHPTIPQVVSALKLMKSCADTTTQSRKTMVNCLVGRMGSPSADRS